MASPKPLSSPDMLNRIQSSIMHALCAQAAQAGRALRCSMLMVSEIPALYVSGIRGPAAPSHLRHSLSLLVGFSPEVWADFNRATEDEQLRLLTCFDATLNAYLAVIAQTRCEQFDLGTLSQNQPGPILVELDTFAFQGVSE